MKPNFLCILLILALPLYVVGQPIKHLSNEELINILSTEPDTSHIRINIEMAWRLQEIYEDDSSKTYIEEGFRLSQQLKHNQFIPQLHKRLSTYYEFAKGDMDSALYHRRQAYKAAIKYLGFKEQFSALLDVLKFNFSINNLQGALAISDSLISMSRAQKDSNNVVKSLAAKAQILHEKKEFDRASKLVDEASILSELISDTLDKANAFQDMANLYWNTNNQSRALGFFLKASDLYSMLEDTANLFDAYFSINNLYDDLGNYPKALEYAKKTTKLLEKGSNIVDLANAYNTIGWVYKNLGSNDSALFYFRKSYHVYESKLPGNKSIAYPIGNIGLMLTATQKYDSAIIYSEKASKLFEILQFNSGVAEAYNNIGFALHGKGDLVEAEKQFLRALTISKEEGDIYEMKNSFDGLYTVYKADKKFELALEALESAKLMDDSLYNLEKIIGSQEMEAQLAKSRDQAMIDALRTKSALDKALIKQQRLISYGLLAFAVLILSSLLLVYRNWKSKKKAYFKLEKKHRELEESKLKIEKQNEQILIQKLQIEEQHKDIIDSINFASRIQHALLKPEDHVNKSLPSHFILYMPRDIVSGDFYWAVVRGDQLYVAVADCTGHGVPGAMMSMLGIAFLNEIVAYEDNMSPSQILEELRNKVIKELGQETQRESNYREGMDMALVKLHLKTNEVAFAGANNPLWIVRNNEILEFKGSKQGISYSETMEPFTEINTQLQPNDTFYIFSDGFHDQFGGKNGKKYKSANFKQVLLSISGKSMEEQKAFLQQEFESWRGELEQVDDVCVIGLRL